MRTRWKTHAILARLQAELDELQRADQFRKVGAVEGINLCSNDYLGLSDDPRLKLALTSAIERQGERVCSTGSRLLSGNSSQWEMLEAKAASFVGAEAAVCFSSGYLANIGVLTSLLGPETTVFSDAANHASIIDGIRLSRANKVIFPHGDLQFLEEMLRASNDTRERFIVVESVFSMDGDLAPIEDLYVLAARYDAGLIVDEAHATGVMGPNGRGIVAQSGRPDCVIATIHTCGKALASTGAFVACAETTRRYIVNKARSFIFSTALPPFAAEQISEALSIVAGEDERRRHLRLLSEYLRVELNSRGFDTSRSESHIVPVVLGSNDTALSVAQSLIDRGFGVKAIRPPTVPAGTARLRLSLTSRLRFDDLATLVRALCDAR